MKYILLEKTKFTKKKQVIQNYYYFENIWNIFCFVNTVAFYFNSFT